MAEATVRWRKQFIFHLHGELSERLDNFLGFAWWNGENFVSLHTEDLNLLKTKR